MYSTSSPHVPSSPTHFALETQHDDAPAGKAESTLSSPSGEGQLPSPIGQESKQKKLQAEHWYLRAVEEIEEILSQIRSDFPLDTAGVRSHETYDPRDGIISDGGLRHTDLFIALTTSEIEHLRQPPSSRNKEGRKKFKQAEENSKATLDDVRNGARKADEAIRQIVDECGSAVQKWYAFDRLKKKDDNLCSIQRIQSWKNLKKNFDENLASRVSDLVELFGRLKNIPSTEESRRCLQDVSDKLSFAFKKQGEHAFAANCEVSAIVYAYGCKTNLVKERDTLKKGKQKQDTSDAVIEKSTTSAVEKQKTLRSLTKIFPDFKRNEARYIRSQYECILYLSKHAVKKEEGPSLFHKIMSCFSYLNRYEIACATLINEHAIKKEIFRANLKVPTAEERHKKVLAAENRKLKISDSGGASWIQHARSTLQEIAEVREERYTSLQIKIFDYVESRPPGEHSNLRKAQFYSEKISKKLPHLDMNMEQRKGFMKEIESLQELSTAYLEWKVYVMHQHSIFTEEYGKYISDEKKSALSEKIAEVFGEVDHYLSFTEIKINLLEILLKHFSEAPPDSAPALPKQEAETVETKDTTGEIQISVDQLLEEADKEINEHEASDEEEKSSEVESRSDSVVAAGAGKSDMAAPLSIREIRTRDKMQSTSSSSSSSSSSSENWHRQKEEWQRQEKEQQKIKEKRKELNKAVTPLIGNARKSAADADKLLRLYMVEPVDIDIEGKLQRIVRADAKAASYYRKTLNELRNSHDVEGKIFEFKGVDELIVESEAGLKLHSEDAQLHKAYSLSDKSKQLTEPIAQKLVKAEEMKAKLFPGQYHIDLSKKKYRIIALQMVPEPVLVKGIERSFQPLPAVIHVHIPYDMKVSLDMLKKFDPTWITVAHSKNMRQHASGKEYAKLVEIEQDTKVDIHRPPFKDREWLAEQIRSAAHAYEP